GAKKALSDFERSIRQGVRSVVIHEVENDADGPRDLARRFRFGTPVAPARAPKLVLEESVLRDDGAWEITGVVRVPGSRTRDLKGSPRLVFAGESGKRTTVKWAEVDAIRDCRVEPDAPTVLVIPPDARSARFRAVTDPTSNPVAADEAAVSVSFNVQE